MKKTTVKQGFTLIELVVVMTIIAILAVLVISVITIAIRTSRETTAIANAKVIQSGMEAYIARNKQTPPPTSTTGGDDPPFAPLPGGQLGTNAISFELITTTYLAALGATLRPTPWCHNGDGYANGGGMMNIYPDGAYTIRPYNAACSQAGMDSHAIIVD